MVSKRCLIHLARSWALVVPCCLAPFARPGSVAIPVADSVFVFRALQAG